MSIKQNDVVTLHFTVNDPLTGEELESTRGDEALAVLQGSGTLPEKVEAALLGKAGGETLTVDLSASEAFGPRKEGAQQRISKKHFKQLGKIQKGDILPLRTENGVEVVTVLKVGHSVVDVDMNHPFAGKDLRYSLEILDVREATPEEIEHGHAHGPGGHHH